MPMGEVIGLSADRELGGAQGLRWFWNFRCALRWFVRRMLGVNPVGSSSGSSPLPNDSDAPLGLLAADWVGFAARVLRIFGMEWLPMKFF